jgi:hypothetical protein
MKRIYVYILTLILVSSCDGLRSDFFEFLFNSSGIKLSRECSNHPSLFSEGRTFEIYSIEAVNIALTTRKMLDKSRINNGKYSRYKIPIWRKTPVYPTQNDTIYNFIHSEMGNKKNKCFDEDRLIKTLQQNGNFYTFLYDSLGKIKLFIWDINHKKLYLLTSYDL